MALKALLTKAEWEKLDEKKKELYTQEGEDYVIELDDKDYKKRISEFRTNNLDLTQKKEALEALSDKYKDIDPAKYKEAVTALEKINELEEADLLKSGKFEDVVARRMKAKSDDYEKEINALKKGRDEESKLRETYQQQLGQLVINDAALKSIGAKVNIRKGALDDVIARAHRTWKLDKDGKTMIPLDGEGKKVFGKSGEQLTLDEWRDQLVEGAPHLFEEAKGGGANGGAGATGTTKDGVRIIPNNPIAIGQNAKDIASGKAVVDMGAQQM